MTDMLHTSGTRLRTSRGTGQSHKRLCANTTLCQHYVAQAVQLLPTLLCGQHCFVANTVLCPAADARYCPSDAHDFVVNFVKKTQPNGPRLDALCVSAEPPKALVQNIR